MMIIAIIAFFISFAATTLIIRTERFHVHFSADTNLDGPQKFHKHIVPRVGGIGIGLGLFSACIFQLVNSTADSINIILLLCSMPAFFIGLLEDLTKRVGVITRLMVTALGAFFAYILIDVQITRIGLPFVDHILDYAPIAILLTIFAISGLANSFNIIDGFNGLSSMTGIIILLALGYMGLKLNDLIIVSSSFILIAAILGFFLWNYPGGYIFLGDGGAYLIGFWIAVLSILIVARNNLISPWFALLINAYPIWETIFSIYRRKFHQGKSPGHPDGIHFHSLLFRRILNRSKACGDHSWLSANSKTSPYLWTLSSLAIIPGLLFWNSTPILMLFFALFVVSYLWIYNRIVHFKTPKWLISNKKT